MGYHMQAFHAFPVAEPLTIVNPLVDMSNANIELWEYPIPKP